MNRIRLRDAAVAATALPVAAALAQSPTAALDWPPAPVEARLAPAVVDAAPGPTMVVPVAGHELALFAESIEIDAFEGMSVVRGRAGGDGSFVLAGDARHPTGAIWHDGRAFDIRPTGELDAAGRPTVEVIELPASMPACGGAPMPAGAPGFDPAALLRPANTDTERVIRVLIGFTPSAAADIGSSAAQESFAAAAIGSTNEAFSLSDLADVQVELAGIAVVDEPTGAASASGRLNDLADVNDGTFDALTAMREDVGADLVALIVDTNEIEPSICGIAFLAPTTESLGFSVTRIDCAIGNLTFAHELGHNFGCGHFPGFGGGVFGDSQGHRWDGNRFRSVMAQTPGSRVPQFSNPGVFRGGFSTGIANQRDNARTIDFFAGGIASFRADPIPFQPLDCDLDGVEDRLAVAERLVVDCDFNGVPDACQIAADPSADADGDGLLDACNPLDAAQFATERVSLNGPVQFDVPALPQAVGDVAIVITARGDLSSAGESLSVNQRTGFLGLVRVNLGEVFGGPQPPDCTLVSDALILTEDAFNDAFAAGPVTLEIEPGPSVAASTCADGFVEVSIVYATELPEIPSCNPADVGRTNGEFGTLDGNDIAQFVSAFLAGDLDIADIADTTQTPTLDGDDIGLFIASFLAGCP